MRTEQPFGSIVTETDPGANQVLISAADGSRSAGPPASPQKHRPNIFYCSTEQMDLWHQVFAEAEHRAGRADSDYVDQERN